MNFLELIILAAGESERFPLPYSKLLLPLKDKLIIEWVLEKYTKFTFSSIKVVIPQNSLMLESFLGRWQQVVNIIKNPFPKLGMINSLRLALKEATSKVGFLIALGDMPLVEEETIKLLLLTFYNNIDKIIHPVYKGKQGHPVIIPAKYKQTLIELENYVWGAKKLLEMYPREIVKVDVNDSGVVLDIDNFKDYANIINKLDSFNLNT